MRETKMGAIEVSEAYPRCRRSSRYVAEYSDMPMSVNEIGTHLRSGYDVSIYVDGWTNPWRCFLDVNGQLRAQCPTATKVMPMIVQVKKHLTVYCGPDAGDVYRGAE